MLPSTNVTAPMKTLPDTLHQPGAVELREFVAIGSPLPMDGRANCEQTDPIGSDYVERTWW